MWTPLFLWLVFGMASMVSVITDSQLGGQMMRHGRLGLLVRICERRIDSYWGCFGLLWLIQVILLCLWTEGAIQTDWAMLLVPIYIQMGVVILSVVFGLLFMIATLIVEVVCKCNEGNLEQVGSWMAIFCCCMLPPTACVGVVRVSL